MNSKLEFDKFTILQDLTLEDEFTEMNVNSALPRSLDLIPVDSFGRGGYVKKFVYTTPCLKVSMTSKSEFQIDVNQVMFKCCTVCGMRFIITVTHTGQLIIDIFKTFKWQ
jgi:hypothetical protein